ncbi:hypothetical protein H1R20_g7436, partial [Candolleomyces eurysporus]
MLYVYDPKALHHILVKDQYIYEESEDFIQTNDLMFGKGLLATLVGEHHRKQRKLLNPVFSTAHLREMTPIFYEVAHKLRKTLTEQVSQGEREIDMLSWMGRTALELIGQSGYGYSFDSLEEGAPEHPFATGIKNLLGNINDGGILVARMIVLPLVYGVGTPKFQRAVVNILPWKALHDLRDMIDTIHNTSVEIVNKTKQALTEGKAGSERRIGRGKDIMSILIKANMEASEEDRLPESEIIAQISTLTFAAMDTTSNALSRILHILSLHPEVQDRLRQEIREARSKAGGDLDYETLSSLPYMDAVCRETLRVYTPLPFMGREAKRDMILPVSTPVTTLDEIWGPDASEWKPERWLSPLPDRVAEARVPGIYSHMMTFLGGGRACIGFKFSQLEMKVVLSLLLDNFKFAPSEHKIIWRWNGIVQPTTEQAQSPNGDKKLLMPLKVSLA